MNARLEHELGRRAERSTARGADAVLAAARHDVATGLIETGGSTEPPRPRWLLAVAAVVAVVGLGAGVLALRDRDETSVGVTSGSDAFCDALAREFLPEPLPGLPDGFAVDLRIYLEPGISERGRDAVVALLEADPGVEATHHVDEGATLEEHRRLAVGDPATVPLGPEELSTSYVVDLRDPDDAARLLRTLIDRPEVWQTVGPGRPQVLQLFAIPAQATEDELRDGGLSNVTLRAPSDWPDVVRELTEHAPTAAVAEAVRVFAGALDEGPALVSPGLASASATIVEAAWTECGLEPPPLVGPGS